jgi:hypothetical protein
MRALSLGAGIHLRQIFGITALAVGAGIAGRPEHAETVDDTPDGDWLSGPFVTKYYDNHPGLWGSIDATLEARAASGLTLQVDVGVSAPVVGGGYACTETDSDNGLFGSGDMSTSDCSVSREQPAPFVGVALGYSI